MQTTSYHQINAPEQDYLYTQASQIPQAGLGLFTAIDLYIDERIAIFHGEELTEAEAAQRAANHLDQYFMVLPNGHILDCRNTPGFAKYANDAAAQRSAFKNNAKIAYDDEGNVCLIAVKVIKMGEEVFCGYGGEYWRKHRGRFG